MSNYGRPTDYNDQMLQDARNYLDNGWINEGHAIPSVVGLACVLDVTKKTLYNWSNKYPEFLHILDKIVETQEQVLLSKGLRSEFNSHITKLVMGKHGYHDRKEVSGPDGSPVEFLASISPTIGPPSTRAGDAQEGTTAGSDEGSD